MFSQFVLLFSQPMSGSIQIQGSSYNSRNKQTNATQNKKARRISRVAECHGSRGYIHVKKWLNVEKLGNFNGGKSLFRCFLRVNCLTNSWHFCHDSYHHGRVAECQITYNEKAHQQAFTPIRITQFFHI